MAISACAAVLNCTDLQRATAFWAELLGAVPRDEATADSDWVTLLLPGGGRLGLQLGEVRLVDPQPIHLDLTAASSRAAEVERALAIGARPVGDWPYPDDADYTVLRDPDRHLFCIVDPA